MDQREKERTRESGMPESNAKACAPCRDAHQACDKGRPCGRCRHLKRTHLCRDPPLRKRGRPIKNKNDKQNSIDPAKSVLNTPKAQRSRLASRLQPYPALLPAAVPRPHPSLASSAQSSSPSSLPLFEEEAIQNLVSSSSTFFFDDEEEEEEEEGGGGPPALLAQYCYRCGVEFVHADAAFCMACGLKRGHFLTHNDFSGRQEVTTRNTNAVDDYSPAAQQNTSSPPFSSDFYSSSPSSTDPELVTPPLDLFSSSYATSASSSASASSPSSSSSNRGVITLWLPPIITNPRKALIPHIPTAHVMACFVDSRMKGPWVLVRPFALEASGSSIIAVNVAFSKLYGYSQSELLGRSMHCLIPEELYEDTELSYTKTLAQLRGLSNCQIAWHDKPCTIAARNGNWLMSTAQSVFYLGSDGLPVCISVQVTSAVPAKRNTAIEWSKKKSYNSWRIAPQSTLALPEDACFHEGSIFSSAPVTSLSMEDEALPELPSIELHSSFSFPTPSGGAGIDGGSSSSSRPAPSSALERHSQDPASPCEPSSPFSPCFATNSFPAAASATASATLFDF